MSCKLDIDLIQGYLDNTLSPIEKIVVEEHLKTCEPCRKELTELKLLFYELEELREDEIDIPPEVSAIQHKVIDEYIKVSNSGNFGLREFIETQKSVLEKAGIFLEFMPGIKPGARYIEKSIRKTPSILYRTISGAYSGGKKLMLMRARA